FSSSLRQAHLLQSKLCLKEFSKLSSIRRFGGSSMLPRALGSENPLRHLQHSFSSSYVCSQYLGLLAAACFAGNQRDKTAAFRKSGCYQPAFLLAGCSGKSILADLAASRSRARSSQCAAKSS